MQKDTHREKRRERERVTMYKILNNIVAPDNGISRAIYLQDKKSRPTRRKKRAENKQNACDTNDSDDCTLYTSDFFLTLTFLFVISEFCWLFVVVVAAVCFSFALCMLCTRCADHDKEWEKCGDDIRRKWYYVRRTINWNAWNVMEFSVERYENEKSPAHSLSLSLCPLLARAGTQTFTHIEMAQCLIAKTLFFVSNSTVTTTTTTNENEWKNNFETVWQSRNR